MLEYQELWLLAQPVANGEISWLIQTSPSERLGQARWQARPLAGWRRWLWRPTLEVVEGDDESLLLTVRRHWTWQAWQVRDADEHRLGTVAGPVLYDVLGRRLAGLSRSPDDTSASLNGCDGQVLASVQRGPECTRLTFGTVMGDNPFLRMLLLAFVLVPDR